MDKSIKEGNIHEMRDKLVHRSRFRNGGGRVMQSMFLHPQ